MKAIKIIIGIFLSIGLLLGGIPTFFSDLSNGVDGAVLFGEAFGIILFGVIIYYLFSTTSNSKKESNEVIQKNEENDNLPFSSNADDDDLPFSTNEDDDGLPYTPNDNGFNESDDKKESNLSEEKSPSDEETIETMKDMVNTFINTPPTASAEERRSLMDKVDLLKILRNNRGFVGETTRVLSEFYFNLDNFSSHALRDKAYKLIDHRNSLYKKTDVVQELSAEEEQELISISNKNLPFIFTVFFCVENFSDKKIKNEFWPNLKLIYTVAVEEHQKTAENMNNNPLIEDLNDEQEEFLIEILAKRFNV